MPAKLSKKSVSKPKAAPEAPKAALPKDPSERIKLLRAELAAARAELRTVPKIEKALAKAQATVEQCAKENAALRLVLDRLEDLTKEQAEQLQRYKENKKTGRAVFPNKARLGESHGRSTLTKKKVLAIRAWAEKMMAAGDTPPWRRKAHFLGMNEATLRDIVSRRTWAHI